ncbi:hypothetical protein D187_008915 [Cystobacter fuscus DSM 2262]|uniref:histidine kinase n=1 Tax=Cystobacter fuscus (strain ATCC 25194 / DSM 2262 / NBRC 100088 / M29) TaxID=1242864 RepID=S9PJW2_CYSF2|nr:hypothetical protein D187_008915 [Cystobacter fuscus DSM 2262]
MQIWGLGVLNVAFALSASIFLARLAPRESLSAAEHHMTYVAERLAEDAVDDSSLRNAVARYLRLPKAYAVVTKPDGTVFGSAPRPPFDPRSSVVVSSGPLKGTRIEVGMIPGGPGPLFLWMVIVIAILVVTSFVAARYLTHPLTRLADAARRFGDGNLAVRVGIRRRDEVGAVARSFDEMAERIERLVRAQRELLANVSHELRTPLARIQVSLDLAEDDPELARESLHDISEELHELQTLISDVLMLARLEGGSAAASGLPPLKLEPTSLDKLCEKAAGKFRVRFPKRELATRVGTLPVCEVDPVLLRRAIDNLLENAAKYSPRDTAIELDASADSAGVQIVVRDRGEGITAEDLPFVFDPFFRADRVRTKKGPGGVGLGLSLVRRIVEAHGGTIALAPAEDRGTRATIRLPVRNAE